MAWAYARQAQLAEETNKRYDGQTLIPFNHGRLAVYTASYLDIGEALLKRLFALIAETDVQRHGKACFCLGCGY